MQPAITGVTPPSSNLPPLPKGGEKKRGKKRGSAPSIAISRPSTDRRRVICKGNGVSRRGDNYKVPPNQRESPKDHTIHCGGGNRRKQRIRRAKQEETRENKENPEEVPEGKDKKG